MFRQECQDSKVSLLSVQLIIFVCFSLVQFVFLFFKLLFESHLLAHLKASSDISPILLVLVLKHLLPLCLIRLSLYSVDIRLWF